MISSEDDFAENIRIGCDLEQYFLNYFQEMLKITIHESDMSTLDEARQELEKNKHTD